MILYVDDEAPNLDVFRRQFDDEFDVYLARSGAEALEVMANVEIGVVVSDHRMEPMTGIELLGQLRERWPNTSRMLLTAYSDRGLLLSASQRGLVQDFVLKPFNHDDLRLRIEQMVAAYRSRCERERLCEASAAAIDLGHMIGLEGGLREVDQKIARIAPTEATALLRGETGTGKELFAHAIHERSKRARGPFISLNCAAIPQSTLELELFGSVRGAFTGAVDRAGLVEQANGGTLFLDEIGELPHGAQAKLLRVLGEREVTRLGSARTSKVNVRVIAATHRNLEQMNGPEGFREDLFQRLNQMPIRLPPLRERQQDIEALAQHFLGRMANELGKRLNFAPDAIPALQRYGWPGNVRELRNVVERAAILAEEEASLGEADLFYDHPIDPRPPPPPPATAGAAKPGMTVTEEHDQLEAAKLRKLLIDNDNSRTKVAKLLGIARTTLNYRIRRLHLE